jgi:hypothetical protein
VAPLHRLPRPLVVKENHKQMFRESDNLHLFLTVTPRIVKTKIQRKYHRPSGYAELRK